jgi:hypothetical protein
MAFSPGLQAQSVGALIGQITDLDTHQPLIGANVMVEGTALGAATDMHGRYRIAGIPVGSYSLRVSMIGYKQQARANIHVVPQRETIVNIALETTVLAGEAVIVTAGFFERTKDAVVSARTVDIEEIRSDPVGAYDVFRMMESLPAVACGTDQINEIIVRGGAPGQNLFVMDHLEIPYPNHFPQSQQQSGGPVALVNTEFLERADFYAGAFPARYGGKVSSVMDVTLREGNRNRHLAEFNFNMSGVGLVAEGPFTERGSYLISYDRSFLDLVIKSIGLTAIPRYSSLQAKVTYNPDLRQKLIVNFLGGKDAIAITGEPEDEKPGTYLADYGGNQYTLGITYKNLFSQQGYLLASLARNYTLFDIDASRIMTGGIEEKYVRKDDSETETTLKMDALYRISDKWELSGGLKLQHAQLSFSDWLYFAPVVQYGYAADAMTSPVPVSRDYFDQFILGNLTAVVQPVDTLVPGYDLARDDEAGIFKSALYSQIRWFPTPRIEVILGSRVEGSTLPEEVTISPRFGLSYALTDKLSLNVSAGRYFQAPFYDQLIHFEGTPGKLTSYYTDQAVAGLEMLFAEDFRGTFEFFTRTYEDLPMSHAETTPDTSDSFGGYVNAGAGHSYGLEVYLQKKFTRQWYGSCSYSLSVAEGIDPRYPGEDQTYPWDYDFRHVFTLIGGYKIKYMDYGWYASYKESLWAKLFSWIPLAPSDEFEISFRGRYVGGRPYTPLNYDHNLRSWTIYQTQDFNTHRLKEYIRGLAAFR